MKVALLSDIHANIYALKEVVREILKLGLKECFIAGDTFGYYPWEEDTLDLLESMEKKGVGVTAVTGNWDPILENNRLRKWISSHYQRMDNIHYASQEAHIWMVHGTPDDIMGGRLYPTDIDDSILPLTVRGTLVLGHTHYPLFTRNVFGGIIINPGSVGQPRDGDTRSSWAILDTRTRDVEFQRTWYDVKKATTFLRRVKWGTAVIAALEKDYEGPLKVHE